jgi:hypothetical protein
MLALLLVLLFVGGLITLFSLWEVIHKLEEIEGSLIRLIDNLKRMKGDRVV